jgi:Putative restriction endonuclease
MAHETPLLASTLPSSVARPTAGGSGLVPYRLTVRQFEKMIDAGIFRDEDHVELLGGLLVDKMVKKDPHNFTIDMLGAMLDRILAPFWIARQEKSAVLGVFWRPEPDIAIARGPRERYRAKGPRSADLGMLIEVADSSYAKDRGPKWRKYAASGVSIYWIVNLPLRQIEVYADPFGRGKSAGYREMKTYGVDDEVPLILEGHEFGRIKVSDIIA